MKKSERVESQSVVQLKMTQKQMKRSKRAKPGKVKVSKELAKNA